MKLGLCLEVGGVKGAVHIGVLKAIEESKKIFEENARKIKYIDIKNI